jgi:uncharacterized protein YjiS (DUF1127 family)
MSTLSSVRALARAEAPSFSLGRFAALLAGTIVVGVETFMNRLELHRSRRQLAELDDRLLRDIGIDRGRAQYEADKGFWV